MSELISGERTRMALRTLALAKLIRSRVGAAEKSAKEHLRESGMQPGDRLHARTSAGESVATVSMGKPRRIGRFEITDAFAFVAWCEENGVEHGGKPTYVFPEATTSLARMEALIERFGGEIPPGVVDLTGEGEPSVIVRQTPQQEDVLLGEFSSARAMLEAAAHTLNTDDDTENNTNNGVIDSE
ncbi:hypothetical protein [Schaalia sp. lx-100]|uniref:hypothetical protein n=1 Tax=Schaalia sp. lx-100 TaxID=2899081 RepID=UPI001E3EF5CA|nr:hypothetical protein [Schaalia sp. lx-100]MCD4557633.1 hypothetical protein [Schaalia sp. lx-100]